MQRSIKSASLIPSSWFRERRVASAICVKVGDGDGIRVVLKSQSGFTFFRYNIQRRFNDGKWISN